MVTILDMMKRLEKINVEEVAAASVEASKEEFIDWQQKQMYAGKYLTGKPIKPFYKPRTIAIKKRKGQAYDRVTLRDRTDFYREIFLDVRSKTFVVDSTDWKSEKLTAKYSDKIWGLGGPFKIGYVGKLYPVFLSNMKSEMKIR